MNKKAMEQSQAQQVATALTVPPETTAVELDVGEVKVEAMEVTADGTTISEVDGWGGVFSVKVNPTKY